MVNTQESGNQIAHYPVRGRSKVGKIVKFIKIYTEMWGEKIKANTYVN